MARLLEIIKAPSESEAIEQIASLYPTLQDFEIVWRRNEAGHFSKRGHTFQILVTFEDYEEPAPEELGEDEY